MNPANKPYQALLFNTERVLHEPAAGCRWFMPPAFYRYVERSRYAALSMDHLLPALREATRYLDEQLMIRSEKEEYRHFVMFYHIFADKLPELKLGRPEIEGLAHDAVFNNARVCFYPDVIPYLPRFARMGKLAVVSDSRPSLERVYREAGVWKPFTSFVLSSVVGAGKPQSFFYEKALDELGVAPEDALLVDDTQANLDIAHKLGINAVRMQRPGQLPEYAHSPYPVIHGLRDLALWLQDGAQAPYVRNTNMLSFA